MTLNVEQQIAIAAMEVFLRSEDNYFLLEGGAGTGKTYCVRQLIPNIRGRIIFTAPTNKATRVLRDTLTTNEYKPECKTIYSLLGLRLEANGEVKELAVPDDPVDLQQYRAVVVDEASMISEKLIPHLMRAAEEQGVRFIFMGDEAQLPPVKEVRSPVWKIAQVKAMLTEVMRYDNQILKLATNLRKACYHPAPQFRPVTDNADGEGVWIAGASFDRQMMLAAEAGRFSNVNDAKAIAWRNATVDVLNTRIRNKIFDNPTQPWVEGDRIVLMEPVKGAEGKPIGSTDDEGTVTHVTEGWHTDWPEYKVWHISMISDDNKVMHLMSLHKDSAAMHARYTEELAASARVTKRYWKDYWEFREAFHKIKHSYAITAHRSQGSTYKCIFVDWRDILVNRNRSEAFRCLYVACTRASKQLILN